MIAMTGNGSASGLIEGWLQRQLPAEAGSWLGKQLALMSGAASKADLFKAIGFAPRKLGKADLAFTADDLAQANRIRAGFDPAGWSVDEAARIAIVLRFAARDPDGFPALFTELCRSAEVGEAIALYRGLPLFPSPDRLVDQAGEGLRTHMRAVFEAIAHRNPFPREQFDQDRWNHMVLKALFIDSTLAPIQGLDERSNAELAQILSDYAHERWAAGRPVTPELWRCLGPFAEGRLVEDLKRVASSSDVANRRAAALALHASPAPEARDILASMGEIAAAVGSGAVSWSNVQPAR